MKRFINGFSQITTVLTVSVIILSAVFVIPRYFGVVPYIVRSGSMEPVIHTGSVAFINQGDKEVRPGDIVTYRLTGPSGSDTLVTHRVIRSRTGSIPPGEMPMRQRISRRSPGNSWWEPMYARFPVQAI